MWIRRVARDIKWEFRDLGWVAVVPLSLLAVGIVLFTYTLSPSVSSFAHLTGWSLWLTTGASVAGILLTGTILYAQWNQRKEALEWDRMRSGTGRRGFSRWLGWAIDAVAVTTPLWLPYKVYTAVRDTLALPREFHGLVLVFVMVGSVILAGHKLLGKLIVFLDKGGLRRELRRTRPLLEILGNTTSSAGLRQALEVQFGPPDGRVSMAAVIADAKRACALLARHPDLFRTADGRIFRRSELNALLRSLSDWEGEGRGRSGTAASG